MMGESVGSVTPLRPSYQRSNLFPYYSTHTCTHTIRRGEEEEKNFLAFHESLFEGP